MEYRVYLVNGIVFRGHRGVLETMRECKGFHRFKVLAVEVPAVHEEPDPLSPLRSVALRQLIARQWGELAGRTVIVNLQMIQCMVELG